ncbi:MAG: hypothetical protein LAP39_19310 [Acidobacteriia bacterium]|nr:hypothetical protein [Terriglobia bacterium]
MPRLVYRAVAALLVAAFTLAGQPAGNWNNVKTLAAATEVRLEVSGQMVRGRLQGVTDNSVVLITSKGEETFARQQIARISQRKSGHRGRNALIGAGIGAGIGFVAAVATSQCPHGCIDSGRFRAAGAGLGVVVGGLLGALLPTGGWRDVYKP